MLMEDALRAYPRGWRVWNKNAPRCFKARMNKFLLATTLVLASSSALCAPIAASEKSSLPADVRALLPRGATSFLCERLLLGPKGTKMLVHVWGAVRPNRPDSNDGYSEFSPSPFCLDIFEPVQTSNTRWGWHLLCSASYMDSTGPCAMIAHWLHPAKKQGPVLEIISGNGAPGVSTLHTLFVWNEGFQEGCVSPLPQEFDSGGTGGGLISQDFGKVDKRGTMTIVTTNSYNGRVVDVTTRGWNGDRFATTSVKRPN